MDFQLSYTFPRRNLSLVLVKMIKIDILYDKEAGFYQIDQLRPRKYGHNMIMKVTSARIQDSPSRGVLSAKSVKCESPNV